MTPPAPSRDRPYRDFSRAMWVARTAPADARRGNRSANATAVIVNESFVQQVLGGGNALGLRIRHVAPEEAAGDAVAPPQWFEIVGVARNLVVNPLNPLHVPPALMYAVAPNQVDAANILVRMRPGTTMTELSPIVREHVAATDASLRLGTVRSLAAGGDQLEVAAQLVALIVALVLVSVLLLSAAGIYAMMSFTVTQRRREIGIRSALGAQPRQVLGSVFARAAWQIGVGLGVGVAVAALLDLGSGGALLHGRSSSIIPAVAATMTAVGLLAALAPARRGLRFAPSEALRADV